MIYDCIGRDKWRRGTIIVHDINRDINLYIYEATFELPVVC